MNTLNIFLLALHIASMRKLSAFFLLAVMLFYSGGYFALFKIRQWNIHMEMDQRTYSVETIRVTYKYYIYHTLRQGKEILLNGMLYDIKAKEISGNQVILKAKFDKKENTLISQLAHFLKDRDHKGNHASKSLTKILKLDFFSCGASNCIYTVYKVYSYPILNPALLAGVITPLLIPPRTIQS